MSRGLTNDGFCARFSDFYGSSGLILPCVDRATRAPATLLMRDCADVSFWTSDFTEQLTIARFGYSLPRLVCREKLALKPKRAMLRALFSRHSVHMALIVQKFGGTSVGNPERIKNVARRVMETQQAGNKVVAVVSAMSGVTNNLIDLANAVSANPTERELDVLLATGEQQTIALTAMAINALGGKAVSLTEYV